MLHVNRSLLTGVLALAALPAGVVHAAEGADWDWMVEPYACAASIGTDLTTRVPPTEAGTDTSFSDIVDKLDGVFMVRVEGRNDRHGAFLDFIYLGLAQGRDRTLLSTETDLDSRIADAAYSFRFSGDRARGLDVYAGARYIDLDANIRFVPNLASLQPRTVHLDKTYVDLLLGARYAWQGDGHWGLTLRGDGSLG